MSSNFTGKSLRGNLAVALICLVLITFAGVATSSVPNIPSIPNVSTSSGCFAAIPFYTAIQENNTRAFLDAFADTLSVLRSLWTCTNFCERRFITCSPSGVELHIDDLSVTGSLPDVPQVVVGSEVVVTAIKISGNGHNLVGTLPPTWGALEHIYTLQLAETGSPARCLNGWGRKSTATH